MVLKVFICILLLVSSPVSFADTARLPAAQQSEKTLRKKEALNAVLRSELGRKFEAYLFTTATPDETANQAKELAERILGKRDKSLMALSAVQLMTEFFYRTGRVGPNEAQKLLLLQGELFKGKATVETYPGKGFAYIAILTVLLMLPFGSPLFRSAFWQFVTWVGDIFGVETAEAGSAVSLREFFSFKFFHRYSIKYALQRSFAVLGPISVVYFFWYDWRAKASAHSVDDEIKAPISASKWNDFVDDLQKL